MREVCFSLWTCYGDTESDCNLLHVNQCAVLCLFATVSERFQSAEGFLNLSQDSAV